MNYEFLFYLKLFPKSLSRAPRGSGPPGTIAAGPGRTRARPAVRRGSSGGAGRRGADGSVASMPERPGRAGAGSRFRGGDVPGRPRTGPPTSGTD